MEELLSYFNFSLEQIISLALFLVITLIQLYYYLYYYRKPVSCYEKQVQENVPLQEQFPSVSVIVLSRNESENLKKNLPSILNQEYPDFEVIVVNDGSTDKSNDLLEALSLEYKHLYHTFIWEPADKALPRRMLSMMIGVKAAKKEMLLFIDPDCVPAGNKWIETMMKGVTPSTDVVLGYSHYKRESGFFRRVARFDNLLFSLKYLSLAIYKKGYIGVLHNFAFRKKVFYATKGLSSCLNSAEGDSVYLNKIIRSSECKVTLDPEGFVSLPINYSRWSEIKRVYMRGKPFFRGSAFSFFKIEPISRLLFYALAIGLLTMGIILKEWGGVSIVVLLFFIRQIVQFTVLKRASLHFKTNRFLFALPILDILQPLYNCYFSLTCRLKKKKRY